MAAIQSIKTIVNYLKNIMNVATPPTPINKEIIKVGVPINKTGIIPSRVVNEIYRRKSEAGVPNVPSEEDLRMERIRVEEIMKELIANAKIEIVLPNNAINVTVYTLTPGGPTPIGIGINDDPATATAKGYGIIR